MLQFESQSMKTNSWTRLKECLYGWRQYTDLTFQRVFVQLYLRFLPHYVDDERSVHDHSSLAWTIYLARTIHKPYVKPDQARPKAQPDLKESFPVQAKMETQAKLFEVASRKPHSQSMISIKSTLQWIKEYHGRYRTNTTPRKSPFVLYRSTSSPRLKRRMWMS